MKKEIIVFRADPNRWSRENVLTNNLPYWHAYGAPVLNRLSYLKEKEINTDHLLFLLPSERAIAANELLKGVFVSPCDVSMAVVESVDKIQNKTQQALFDGVNSFFSAGEKTILGARNQQLKIKIEMNPLDATPELFKWDEEQPFVFRKERFTEHVVVSHGVTPAQNMCYSLALGCKLENGLLQVGEGSKFYFCGSAGKKEITFDYYYQYNQNKGKSILIPGDMDILKFNFHYYQWEKALLEGEYVKKDLVSVVKTDKGNYVVFQDNPTRSLLVMADGKILKRTGHPFEFGRARVVGTTQYSLENYEVAIQDYEAFMDIEREKSEKALAEKLMDLYEELKGWYVCELPCFENNFRSGGHKKVYTNWKVLADSKIGAYNKALELASDKGYFFFAEATNCQIDYYGTWDDKKEDMLREEDLV